SVRTVFVKYIVPFSIWRAVGGKPEKRLISRLLSTARHFKLWRAAREAKSCSTGKPKSNRKRRRSRRKRLISPFFYFLSAVNAGKLFTRKPTLFFGLLDVIRSHRNMIRPRPSGAIRGKGPL